MVGEGTSFKQELAGCAAANRMLNRVHALLATCYDAPQRRVTQRTHAAPSCQEDGNGKREIPEITHDARFTLCNTNDAFLLS